MVEIIADSEKYHEEMSKSMLDKMFFLQHISPSTVVDYGCADGALGEYIRRLYPLGYIGYDKEAHKPISRFGISGDIENFHNRISHCDLDNTAIVFSSLFHEVCHYQGQMEARKILDWAKETGFKWIVIRDMFYRGNTFDYELSGKILRHGDRDKIKDHEKFFGPVELLQSGLHFLLKYRYHWNWEREVQENYFSIPEGFPNLGAPWNAEEGYKILHHESFVVPFIKYQVQKDFKYHLTIPTHFKMILERK